MAMFHNRCASPQSLTVNYSISEWFCSAELAQYDVRTGTVCTYVVPDEPVRWIL